MLLIAIFAVLAIVVVVAFILQMQRRRDYERTDDDLG
jgi:Flp pilus assembly protein TadB